MPDSPREMSLEDRLFASLRIKRSKPAYRSSLQNGNTSRPRVPGSIKTPLEVVTHQTTSTDGLKRATAQKKKPLRFGGIPQNPKYLAFIRTQPCILNGLATKFDLYRHVCSGVIEAAHTGMRGMKQKGADESALPMCCNAHRTGIGAHHKTGRKFWEIWGIDRAQLVAKYNLKFAESK